MFHPDISLSYTNIKRSVDYKMWGALLGATLAFPQPYTHLVHSAWYLARSFVVPPPVTVEFDGKRLYPYPYWYVFPLVSAAYGVPDPNLLDYTWIPLVLFCIMGYKMPLWIRVIQTSFFGGYVHLRPQAAFVVTTVLWKYVDMSPRALRAAALLHGLLAVFEPWGDPSFIFVSLVAAECKYRMSFQPRQVVFLWLSSFAGMLYERRLAVWIFPAISSLGLGDWTHQWIYTDKIYNGYGIYIVCALVFSACVVP